ncbi:g11747 [Coccomyxa elongata]
MSGNAFKKLQELKDEMEHQDQELENAFEAGPSQQHEISMKGVGTFRVEEPESVRLIARKQRAQREEAGDRYQTCKLVGVVVCAAGLAIFLLWLLFSGGEPQKVLSPPAGFQKPPINASELQKMRPQNACPEPEWLPDACLGSMRQKSKKVFDECQLFFEETGYSLALLKACGILTDAP